MITDRTGRHLLPVNNIYSKIRVENRPGKKLFEDEYTTVLFETH